MRYLSKKQSAGQCNQGVSSLEFPGKPPRSTLCLENEYSYLYTNKAVEPDESDAMFFLRLEKELVLLHLINKSSGTSLVNTCTDSQGVRAHILATLLSTAESSCYSGNPDPEGN